MTDWHRIDDPENPPPKDGTRILAVCRPKHIETGKPMGFDYVNVVWWRGKKYGESLWPWRHSLDDSAAEPILWLPLDALPPPPVTP